MKRTTVPQKVINALLQLGLTEKEVGTYLVLLEKGASSVQDISRFTEINRVTVYAALEILKKRGLVAESKKGKRTMFVAEDPNELRELVQEKKRTLKKEELALANLILPSLQAVVKDRQQKPQIRFYQDVASMHKIFDEIIVKNTRYLIGSGSYETALKATNWKYEKEFFDKLKKKKILYKVVLEDTPLNRQFAELGIGAMHVKFLPKGQKVTADIHTFNDSICLMSYETMVTTVLEEASLAQSIRFYLEFMWERL